MDLLDVKKKRYSFMSVFKQEAGIHTLASVNCQPDKVDLIEFRGCFGYLVACLTHTEIGRRE